jgi:large subunit ribosomal protein L35
MPKMKTNRTAYKKLFPNKNGNAKRGGACHSHNTGKKSAKRSRRLAQGKMVDATNLPTVMRMLPYGGK